jgi:hypothetical protein
MAQVSFAVLGLDRGTRDLTTSGRDRTRQPVDLVRGGGLVSLIRERSMPLHERPSQCGQKDRHGQHQ